MAVSGRTVTSDLIQASDDWHDFSCSPCSKEDKNVAAEKFCIECDESLCTTCLKHHNKFAVMRGHQLLDNAPSQSGQKRQLPSQRCDKHGGKLIDVFCPQHDKVGCSTCVAVEHSSCKGIQFIPDLKAVANVRTEAIHLEVEIRELKSRFDILKQKKESGAQTLQRQQKDIRQEIADLRRKISERLDSMENELIEETEEYFKTKIDDIEAELQKVDSTLALLSKSLQDLKESDAENNAELFVHLKLANDCKLQARKLEGQIERTTGRSVSRKLAIDQDLKLIFAEHARIGSVTEIPNIRVISKVGDANVGLPSDEKPCFIHDVCILADEIIAVTDGGNQSLKTVSYAFNILDEIKMPGIPYGVCQVDEKCLAVTIRDQKKVQLVSMNETMGLQTSFPVEDRCRGIASKDGYIYVCCGGEIKERQGHIAVYDTAGTLIKAFFHGLASPKNVKIFGNMVYVIDSNSGLIVIDQNGILQSSISKDKLAKAKTSANTTGTYKLEVAFTDFDKTQFITIDDKEQNVKAIYAQKNGIIMPAVLRLGGRLPLLSVTSHYEPNVLKVFGMEWV